MSLLSVFRRAVRVDDHHIDTAVGDLYVFTDSDRLVRYIALHLAASLIAVLALASDQPSVVIGAMLLAPLMTPVLGLAAALIRADTADAARAGLLVAISMVITLGVGWALVTVVPSLVNTFFIPNELLSRTEPNLADLFIALAAGAAGAFATVRPDVSASLPGVAVAVALVPPLATAGVLFGIGDASLAFDALLLFITNVVAIVAAAVVVFAVAGIRPGSGRWWYNIRVLGVLAVGVVSIGIPLTLAYQAAARDTQAQEALQAALDDLRDSLDDANRSSTDSPADERPRFSITDANLQGDVLVVRIESSAEPRVPTTLAESVSADLGTEIEIQIEWIQIAIISSNDDDN